MNTNKEKAINDFLEDDMDQESNVEKKKIISGRGEIVEKVDRVYITEDGRQLLREHY
jgi:hypothetical protein